jgi:hypothetical protein
MVIFSTPKPLTPETRPVQVSAFRSWQRVFPGSRLILFGYMEGLEELCREEGIIYGGQIPTHYEFPKMMISRMFQRVASDWPAEICLFLNSDILLDVTARGVLRSLDNLKAPWLATGRRRRLPPFEHGLLDSAGLERFLNEAMKTYEWGNPTALDIYMFRGMDFQGMPDFIIGNCAWDNWMIWNARSKGIPVLDLSRDFPLFHCDHEYQYSLGNTAPRMRSGPLEENNLKMLGGEGRRFHLGHCTHEMKDGTLRPKRGWSVLQRNLELWRLLHPRHEWWIRRLRYLLTPLLRISEAHTTRVEKWIRKKDKSTTQTAPGQSDSGQTRSFPE